MVGVAVAEHRAAFVGEVADGVISVGAVLLRLVGPEGPGRCDHPIEIVVGKHPACRKQTIGD
jgi:hypothetical protein